MKASKTAIAWIVQMATGLLVLLGMGHETAAELASQLGLQLQTLVGTLLVIWAGLGATMNKIRSGSMSGGLAGFLIKRNGE